MNNQRPYQQQMARPSNQAGPTIRAGLSVQELKAMTAMRVAHDSDSPNPGINPRDVANIGPYRNPASSYQTATPQQLQAAGIQPVVVNERPVLRQAKPTNPNSFGNYASGGAYGEQDAAGQNRAYSYDEYRSGPPSVQGGSTSSYAKASSTAGTAPALSAYHQQILPNRSGGPQINSVEDVKEMTRLRMLMAERDAFFESPANGHTGSGSGRSSSHRSNPNTNGPQSGHSGEFEAPFEDTANGRYGARYHNGNGSAGPSVNNSTDSYDSYDYPAVVPQEARARGLQPSHSQGHSLYAPAAPLHALYSGDYGSTGSSANSSTKLSQSSSLGGLGLSSHASGTRTTNSSFSADLSSPLGGPMASPSVGYGSNSMRPNVGGPARPSPPSTQLGLGLAGSNALGLGPSSRRAPGAPLAPVSQHTAQGQYGYPVERGIERNLMLNSQLPSNHHGLLNGPGGIDRVEHSLNAHNHHSLYGNGSQASQRGAFEDDLHRLLAQSDTSASRLTSGLSSNAQGASVVSPTTHSARSSHLSANPNNNNYSASSNQSSFLYSDTSGRGGDMSLNALLGGGSELSSYAFGGPRVPLERDNLYDLLTADPMAHSANHNNGLLGTSALLPGLEGVTVSPQKVVLGPLGHHVSSPSTTSTTSASTTGVSLSQLESKLTPRTLAPLATSDASPSAGKDTDSTKQMRKLSQVGKAATYNDAISTSNKDKHGAVVLPDLSLHTSPSKLLLEPLEAMTLPPQRFQAFGDGQSNNNHNHYEGDPYGTSPLGIASPDQREYKESDGSTASSSGSNSPITTSPHPNHTNTNNNNTNNNKRFPMIKASTTSRLPDSQHPGTKSPKLMIASKYANGHNNNNNTHKTLTPSGEHTPPHMPLDRTASDSTSMNFLASEMAEMVLDTPYRQGSSGIPPHSRDNSSDLSRLLAAIHGTSPTDADNSLPSVTSTSHTTSGMNFKRIPSISSFLGFE